VHVARVEAALVIHGPNCASGGVDVDARLAHLGLAHTARVRAVGESVAGVLVALVRHRPARAVVVLVLAGTSAHAAPEAKQGIRGVVMSLDSCSI